MSWFRSHGRLWSMAALLALIFQVALSFGHVHGFDAHPATAAALADTGGDSFPPSTPDTDRHNHDKDHCAIYTILALLTGAQTATAPAVAPPAALTAAEIIFASEAIRISASRASFQSRAPPLS